MGKKIFAWRYVVLMLGAIASSGARAATSYDGGYVRVGVPDMTQTETFFRDVLDCQPIGAEATASEPATASLLLSCDEGSVVELFVDRGKSPSPASDKPSATLQLATDDVARANEWLRNQGVAVSGAPHRVISGSLAGHMVLDFAAPWGLRLQLVGRNVPDPGNTGLTTADIQYDGG